MKVKIARNAGFCMGVQRAVNMVLDAVSRHEGKVYTYGPLIHNPQAIGLLEKRGVKVVEDVDSIPSGTVLIRAHGIPPRLRSKIKASSLKVCDATCPRVGSVQAIIKKYVKKGYTPVIVGDAGHPEVVGLMGYSEGLGIALSSVEELKTLPPLKKVLVVAQTTQDAEKYKRIVEEVKARYHEVASFYTICEYTDLSQKEVRKMAREVDAMVVVGGKSSGNTRRLAEISKDRNAATYHVESEEELKPELFPWARAVGVTAGSSTPHWMVRRVVERLIHIKGGREHPLFAGLIDLLRFLSYSGIYTSLAVLGPALTSITITGSSISPLLLSACALFIFSQEAAFNIAHMETISLDNPLRGEFYKKHRKLLSMLAAATGLLSLMLSATQGLAPFVLLAIALGSGMLAILPLPHKRGGTEAKCESTPGLTSGEGELTRALSWAMALSVALTTVGDFSPLSSLLSGIYVFLMALLRFNFVGLHGIQEHKMLGRRTMAALLGERKAVLLSYWLIAALVALPAVGAATHLFPFFANAFAISPAYLLLLMRWRKIYIFYPFSKLHISLDAAMFLLLTVALFMI